MLNNQTQTRLGLLGAVGRLFRRYEDEAVQPNPPPHTIIAPVIDITPSGERRKAARDLLLGLIDADDWPGIGAVLEEWAASGARTEDGRFLLDGAIDLLVEATADGYIPPSFCMPHGLPWFEHGTLAQILALGRTLTEQPGLAAYGATCLTLHAWELRGVGSDDLVGRDAWEAAQATIDKAEAILAPYTRAHPFSPYVAEARIGFLPFRARSVADVSRAWRHMAEANPAGLTGIRDVALFLLPRWFGTPEGFDTALREAAFATSKQLGLSAYAVGLLSVMDEEPASLLWIDPDMLDLGLADYAALRRADPAEIARLYLKLYALGHGTPPIMFRGADREEWQHRQVRIAKTARSILAQHLTAIVPDAWGGEVAARAYIAAAYREDLGNGARVRLGKEGIAVVAG